MISKLSNSGTWMKEAREMSKTRLETLRDKISLGIKNIQSKQTLVTTGLMVNFNIDVTKDNGMNGWMNE
jgi:hypothetical protein